MKKSDLRKLIAEEIQNVLKETEFLRKAEIFHDSVPAAIQAVKNALSFSPTGWIIDPKDDLMYLKTNNQLIPIPDISKCEVNNSSEFIYNMYNPVKMKKIPNKLHIVISKDKPKSDFPDMERYEVTAYVD